MESRYAIVDRVQNFRWNLKNFEKTVRENPNYFTALETLKDEIVAFSSSDSAKGMSNSELLFEIFSRIYPCVKTSSFLQVLLFNQHSLGSKIYEACLFTTLCTFLHSSERIQGKSLKEFVCQHHPLDFNHRESPYDRIELLKDESDRLRRSRQRLFSQRAVYIKDTQWAAMPKDSEHEWSFFYALDGNTGDGNLPEAVKDTYKRIKNLYNDIYKALKTEKDSGYGERLKDAYKKFMSKLSKIKYENYLELQKVILFHICENKEYYGMNIYRLEKEMKPYITIHEVKKLSTCRSIDEKPNMLIQFTILKDICFPKVYEFFAQLPLNAMVECAVSFWGFLETTNFLSCLILDELVEKEIFGDDWETLFRTAMNEVAESVFYNPSELDFTVTTESQKNFMDIISAPVKTLVCREMMFSDVSDTGVDDKY